MQAKSLLEVEVKQRCQAQRPGGGGVRGVAALSVKQMEFFHSMGIAGMAGVHAYHQSAAYMRLARTQRCGVAACRCPVRVQPVVLGVTVLNVFLGFQPMLINQVD